MDRFKVYIYGAGNEYRKLSPYLKRQGNNIEVQAIVTTAPQEFESLDGYSVIRPDKMNMENFDYVIVAVVQCEEIISNLLSLGVAKEKILRSSLFYGEQFSLEKYKCLELLFESTEWLQNGKYVERLLKNIEGKKIESSIMKNYGEGTQFIILNGHIGGAMNFLKIIKAYRSYSNNGSAYHNGNYFKKDDVKQVVVVTNKVLAGVAGLYEDIDDIIILQKEQLNCLHYCASSYLTSPNFHVGDPPESSEWAKYHIFNMPRQNWQMTVPIGEEWGTGKVTNRAKASGNIVLEEYNIVPEKTVICCPYAQTTSQLSGVVWNVIVKGYQQKGFRVFTNVGHAEKELENTERLEIPIDAFVGIVDAGCLVVGVQSGLLDVLCWTEMRRKVYVLLNVLSSYDRHWSGKYGNTKCEGVTYLIYENETDDKLMEKISRELF